MCRTRRTIAEILVVFQMRTTQLCRAVWLAKTVSCVPVFNWMVTHILCKAKPKRTGGEPSLTVLRNSNSYFMYKVAVYVYVAGGDYECLGVNALYYALKLLQLVAVYAGAEHCGGLVGVCAVAVPAGNAAASLLHYALGYDVVPVLGEYKRLHVDALLVHPVQYEA